MHVMIRSKIKPEYADRNREMLRDVYTELHETRPERLRYGSFVLDDGVTLVAFAELDGPEVLHPLQAFQRYRAALDDWCDEPPELTVLHELGSYGWD